MQALVAPADMIKNLNTLFFRFIWKKKYSNTFEKVKRRIIRQKMEGGLSTINVDDLHKSFLLSWTNILMKEKEEKRKQIPTEMMSRLVENVCCFSSDLSVKYFKGLGLIKNTFWRKVLSCWLDNKQKRFSETQLK